MSISIEGEKTPLTSIYVECESCTSLGLFLQEKIALIINDHLSLEDLVSDNQIHLGIGASGFHESIFANCEKDAFYLGAKEGRFYILGNTKVGLEFGIYEFVEKYLGIISLFPTKEGEYIPPPRKVILENSGSVYNPVFKSRQLSPLDYYGSGHVNEWAKRSKVFSSISFHHNMNFFLKNSSIKDLDREIFPIYGGDIYIPKSENDFRWQPNFKSSVFLDFSIRKVLDYFRRTNSPTFSLGINDNYLVADNMKGGEDQFGYVSYSEDYYGWVNKLVNTVSGEFPNRKYGLLAYYNVANPPSFSLNRNVVPFITYERIKWRDATSRRSDQALTRQWSKKARELGWYDYQYGYTYLIPRVFSQLTKENLIWAKNNQVKYYYAELYPNWGEGPKYWVLTKLLWDPSLDVQELENQWYEKAVGSEAAKYLKEYYDIWERYWTKDLDNPSWFNKQSTFLPYNDLDYMLGISLNMISSSENNLTLVLDNVRTDAEAKRAQIIYQMWKLYRAAIEAYKTGHYRTFNSLKNDVQFMKQLQQLSEFQVYKPLLEVYYQNLK